jgi:MscS family membrane protein
MGLAVSRALSIFLIYLIRGWFNKKRYHLDEKLEQDFLKPIRITFMAWIWWTALSVLGLPADALDLLRTAAIVVTAIGAVWAFYRLIDILDKYLSERAANTHNRYDDLLIPIVTKTLKIFVAAIALVAVAEYKDWEYNNVLAGLGLGGLAFALAAKDVVANIFGSITILLDRPFEIGDWVTIGGVDGNVESVGIRSTRIRTFYNSLISVPNAELTNATVDNWGKRRYRRIKTTLGLAYDTPPEKIEAFCEGVRELIRQHPYTRKDYFHVYLNEFSASSLDILLYCFVETPEWSTELRERHRLFVDVTRLAQRLQVEFAFPTQTVHLRQDETEGTPMPLPHADALEHGQSQARAIVGEFLGGPGVIPPPVSFDVAGGTKRAPLDNPEGEEGQSEGES